MRKFINDIFSKLYANIQNGGCLKYFKLHNSGDMDYEIEVQKKKIELEGNRVLDIIRKGKSCHIVYRCGHSEDKFEGTLILLRLIILESKGIRRSEPSLDAYINNSKKVIEIGDIRVFGQSQNQGYGSILISQLIQIANCHDIKNITGWISDVDWPHVAKLKHFYEKHGFKVVLDHKNKRGDILLEIVY